MSEPFKRCRRGRHSECCSWAYAYLATSRKAAPLYEDVFWCPCWCHAADERPVLADFRPDEEEDWREDEEHPILDK